MRSAITVVGMSGNALSSSRTRDSTGVNIVSTGGREYRGGSSPSNARSTVVLEMPNRLAIARLLNLSRRCRTLISAQSSMEITHPMLLRWPTFR